MAFPREVELLALFVGDVLGEELADFLLDRTGILTQIEFDLEIAHVGQAGGFAGVETAAGFGEPVFRVACDQRPGLGAQVVEVNVVFGGKANAAKGLHGMAHRSSSAISSRSPAGSACSVPDGERNLCAGFSLSIGDRAHGPPGEELGGVDFADQVGHRMRQRLEGADEYAESLAFAGIFGRHHQGSAAEAGQRHRHQQLPFLEAARESGEGIVAAGEDGRGQGAEVQFGDGRGREIGLCHTRLFRHGNEHDVVALARDDSVGNQTAGDPLFGELGDVVHCDGDDRCAGNGIFKQFVLTAETRQQAGGNQRFGERTGDERPAGFFHQDTSIEQAESHAAGFFGYAHGECAEFGETGPEFGIEAAAFLGLANPGGA